MTPSDKKASELAVQYAAKQNHTIVSALISEADFKAGFMAALELAEVKGIEEALSKAHDCMGNAGQTAWDGNDELKRKTLRAGRQQIRDALTAWKKFRGGRVSWDQDPPEMEEPIECDCGRWVELQDTIPCRKCNDLYCRNCLKHGLCELCDEIFNEGEG